MNERQSFFALLVLSALWAPSASAAPPNDDFAGALTLDGPSGTTRGTNEGATREPGEPMIDSSPGGRSIWWRRTAPAAEEVTFHTFGSDFDTILGVYTGTAVHALTTVKENDDWGIGTRLHSAVTFRAVAGSVYHFAVDGVHGDFGPAIGDVVLSWRSGPPTNDALDEGLTLDGPSGHSEAFNAGATREMGEPSIAGNQGGRSVWWRWVAPRTESVAINTLASDFDTLLGVYTGAAVTSLTPVAENDDAVTGGGGGIFIRPQSRVEFEATAGTLYHIVVDGLDGATGYILLSWLPASDSKPANDSFAGRIRLDGPEGRVTGTSVEATREAGEPDHALSGGTASVWWSWVAPGDGTGEIDTSGAAFDTVLAVYTGSSPSGLVLLAENDDDMVKAVLTSVVRFRAIAGTEHQIAVDGFDGDSGMVVLRWSFTPDPDSPRFIRGDCDGNGKVDITDAICTLAWLFQGGEEPECAVATNADGMGGIDLTDAIHLLLYLFRGGSEPAAPFPRCGIGTLPADEVVGCVATPATCR